MRMFEHSCVTVWAIVANFNYNEPVPCIHCCHKDNTEMIFIIVVQTAWIWWGPDGNVFVFNGPHTVQKILSQSKAYLYPAPVMLCWYWEVFFP